MRSDVNTRIALSGATFSSSVGKRTYFTPSGLAAQLRSHGHAVDPSAIEVDRTTIHRLPGYGEIVTDRSIFHALGIDSVKALDASPYEGAEIVHDLNRPLPDNFKEIADFIVDGSTLDNVFDPAMTLRNFAQLLRPGGRLLAINTLNTRDGAYTICSPDWFLDYFVENGFSDCKVYVCAGFAGSYNSYWLDTEYIVSQKPSRLVFPAMWWSYYTLVFAEKGPASTTERVPTQQTYRSAEEWTRYVAQLSAINRSPATTFGAFGGNALAPLGAARIQLDGQEIRATAAKTVPAASDPPRFDAPALPPKSLTHSAGDRRPPRFRRIHRHVNSLPAAPHCVAARMRGAMATINGASSSNLNHCKASGTARRRV